MHYCLRHFGGSLGRHVGGAFGDAGCVFLHSRPRDVSTYKKARGKMKLETLARYSIAGLLKVLADTIRTKLTYRKARLIRSPFYIRGRKNIDLGSNLTTGVGVRIDAFNSDARKVVHFGRDVQINDYVHISAIENVAIGDNVLIASRVFISDHNHGDFSGLTDPTVTWPPAERPLSSKPICIEESVWIGENVCILPGVTIGRNAVIGAGAVVTKSVPSWSLAVGNPAVVIKRYDQDTAKWVRV